MIDGSPRDTVGRRRRRVITLVVAAVIVLIAVTGVITSLVLASGSERTASPADRVPSPAVPARPADALPPQPEQQPLGQRPGTIRLPHGGTATLVRKEVDRSGTLPIPDGVGDAAWWGAGLDSPAGATVLAGHVNWKGAAGPFAELWQSAPDELVTVVDADGHIWRYRTNKIVTVTKDDLPRQARELFSQGGEHRLVLVTCGGRFVGGDAGYKDNRIVVATPVK